MDDDVASIIRQALAGGGAALVPVAGAYTRPLLSST